MTPQLPMQDTPEVLSYRAAAHAFDTDPVAQRLLADLREQQIGLSRLQQSGLTPSQVQVDGLRLCHAAVRANETIMVHLQATNDAKAYLPALAAKVSATLGRTTRPWRRPPAADRLDVNGRGRTGLPEALAVA